MVKSDREDHVISMLNGFTPVIPFNIDVSKSNVVKLAQKRVIENSSSDKQVKLALASLA
jgi:hypothetical protein